MSRSHPSLPPFRVVLALLAVAAAASANAETLASRAEKRVRAATFEVVVELPKADPLTYEKPLPLDLLPFAIREATHLPFGTAFAIGANRYVTAAHVLGGGIGSQLGSPKLRDATGRIYEIAQVLEYSSSEDFAVFSLADPPRSAVLETEVSPALNSTVFAVGNALGEGIIIRDGVLTSSTPEALDGRWSWLRFSAAASPGNSGGPLLDRSGRVVGVVVAKSPNENLNYALPIQHVLDARQGKARMDTRVPFSLGFTPQSIVYESRRSFDLPLAYPDFAAAVLKTLRANFDEANAEVRRVNADRVFPRGEGSQAVLHTTEEAPEPRLVAHRNGTWELKEIESVERSELGKGGFLAGGQIDGTGLARMRLPDDVALASAVADSRLFMDLFLKGNAVTRQVGPEAVRVTSAGPAGTDEVHVDGYGRKWLLRTWRLPYADAYIVSAALPVPDGFVVISALAQSGLSFLFDAGIRAYTDFVYVTYTGTLARWRAFRELEDLQPAALGPVDIEVAEGERFGYRSPRLELEVDTDLMNIGDDAVFSMQFAFFEDGGKVVWDVARIWLQEGPGSRTWVGAGRNTRPPEAAGQRVRERWDTLERRRPPFDGVPRPSEGMMLVVSVAQKPGAPPADASPVIYDVTYGVDAPFPPDVMRDMRRELLGGVRILE